MLYLAIDQHKTQLTINIRNEQGDVIQKGQVSTNHTDIDDFFAAFAKKARKHRGYMAIVEVCGFNDWLLEKLKKTINKVKGILNKHNMAQDAPTQLYHMQKFRQWIKTVQLPVVDRLEVDMNIAAWELYDKQMLEVEAELVKRSEVSETKMKEVYRLKAIPGISAMGAITLLSRIDDIKRFKNPDSLANYFGLTPGCHNTGGKHRVGGITKRGNAIARNVLNFAVHHIVRKDPLMKEWYKNIKKRRRAKTAMVAVMRHWQRSFGISFVGTSPINFVMTRQ